LRDVWVEYGDKVVLERVNLDVAAGSFVSVVGPSGAGKSTLLRVVLGQEAPSRGAIQRFRRGEAREVEITARPPRPVPLTDLGDSAAGGAAEAQRLLVLGASAR
jgi:ABC-type Fe3+/spermidine/putrescine transport system ATPase subunit